MITQKPACNVSFHGFGFHSAQETDPRIYAVDGVCQGKGLLRRRSRLIGAYQQVLVNHDAGNGQAAWRGEGVGYHRARPIDGRQLGKTLGNDRRVLLPVGNGAARVR